MPTLELIFTETPSFASSNMSFPASLSDDVRCLSESIAYAFQIVRSMVSLADRVFQGAAVDGRITVLRLSDSPQIGRNPEAPHGPGCRFAEPYGHHRAVRSAC